MEPTDATYMISCARIREIEQDLHDWYEQLPPTWRPGPEEDTQITRYVVTSRPMGDVSKERFPTSL